MLWQVMTGELTLVKPRLVDNPELGTKINPHNVSDQRKVKGNVQRHLRRRIMERDAFRHNLLRLSLQRIEDIKAK